MSKSTTSVIVLVVTLALCGSALADWDAFVIRKSGGDNVSGVAPAINDVTVGGVAAKEFVISLGSRKAAWGTNDVNGATVGQITSLVIDRLDDETRFAAGSGPAVAPYFNIWVTDGAGNYAVIANEPSNPAFQPLYDDGYDLSWADLADKVVKAYENADLSWINNLDTGGDGLTFSDAAGLEIAIPPSATATWAGLGGGAPRVLNPDYDGTNQQYLGFYGFNWVFGDTMSNYVSGDPGYQVANPSAVPEPATMSLLALSGAAIFRRRRG